MKNPTFARITNLTLSLVCLLLLVQFGKAQSLSRIDKEGMKDILTIVKNEVKKNYYDPTYRGIDIEARFKKASEKLDQVTSTGQALAVIAQVLVDFNDSHLVFIPPPTNLAVEYGWVMQAIGDKVFITQVKPGSDASAKGLKPGDQVLSVSGFRPSRGELWKVLYYYNAISKRDKLVLSVVSPGEAPRDLEIKSELKKLPRSITFSTYFRLFDDFYDEENDKHRWWTLGNTTLWKMPSFGIDPANINGFVDNAKNGGSLILDLRGNGGGPVKVLEQLTGNFFDKDIKIAELKGRKPMDPSIAKTRGKGVFTGKLIVLIDSNSGSAAEAFARVIQLEQRGKVLGDKSSGAVTQARYFSQEMGTYSVIPFGISITNADVIMSDGKSLEHVGVMPDELILPTPEDLAAGRDPVLARAFEIVGVKLTPEDAGKFIKYYWKKD